MLEELRDILNCLDIDYEDDKLPDLLVVHGRFDNYVLQLDNNAINIAIKPQTLQNFNNILDVLEYMYT